MVEDSYNCSSCGQIFFTLIALKSHEVKAHKYSKCAVMISTPYGYMRCDRPARHTSYKDQKHKAERVIKALNDIPLYTVTIKW